MKIPSVIDVLKLSDVLGNTHSFDELQLVKSMWGKPVMKAVSNSSTRYYVLTRKGPPQIKTINDSSARLRFGDVVVEYSDSEVVLKAGSGEFRGSGFFRVSGTSIYIAACRKHRCLVAVGDVVDGVAKIYDLGELDSLDVRRTEASLGYHGFSLSNPSFTISVSMNGIEVLPGFFRYIASCHSGDYLVDREGLLVRTRRGYVDILGKIGDVVTATCITDGVALADREGVKLLRHGVCITTLKEAVGRLSSHGDTIVAVNKAGLIKVFNGRDSYTLDSPRLRHCEATADGVVCLTDDSIIFLDPLIPSTVKVGFENIEVVDKLAELVISPWHDGCRLSITPRIIQVYESMLKNGVLHTTLYPRVPGWEGFVKVCVDCPTYYRITEGYMKSGSVVVEQVLDKSLFIATSGRVLESTDHNCVGKITLKFLSRFPLPIPVKVGIVGIENAQVTTDRDRVSPGHDDISVRFSGRCHKEGGIIVKVFTDPRFLDPIELATVYVDLNEGRRIEQKLVQELEVVNLGYRSIVKVPNSFLKLHCLNGKVFEGYEYLLVEKCEEPALLQISRVVNVDDVKFELNSSILLRKAIEQCSQCADRSTVSDGGFYANCYKYVITQDMNIQARIDYEGNIYGLTVYLDNTKLMRHELDPSYLISGLSIRLGRINGKISWRDLILLALKTSLSVSQHIERVVYGEPNI